MEAAEPFTSKGFWSWMAYPARSLSSRKRWLGMTAHS